MIPQGIRRTMTWHAFVCSLFLFSGIRLFPATTTNKIIEQSPVQITVTEGGTVHLNCTDISKLNETQKPVGSIAWYKDEESRTVCNRSGEFQGRIRTSSLTGILSQSLQILNIRMNDTGTYYCKIEIFGMGNYFGKGTDVQVTTAAVRHNEELLTNERNIVLYVSPLLVIVLLALTLFIIIIYRKRCVRSEDGRSATQVVPQKEESVLYAEMNIRKAPRTRPSDYAACESGRTGPSSQAGKDEDPILYAEVRATSHRKNLASMKSRRREEEQVVYAALNVQRM